MVGSSEEEDGAAGPDQRLNLLQHPAPDTNGPHGHDVGSLELIPPGDQFLVPAGLHDRLLQAKLSHDLPKERGFSRSRFHHPKCYRGCRQLQGYRRRSPARSDVGDGSSVLGQSLRGDQGLDDESVDTAFVIGQCGQIDATVPPHQQSDIGSQGRQESDVDVYASSGGLPSDTPGELPVLDFGNRHCVGSVG